MWGLQPCVRFLSLMRTKGRERGTGHRAQFDFTNQGEETEAQRDKVAIEGHTAQQPFH